MVSGLGKELLGKAKLALGADGLSLLLKMKIIHNQGGSMAQNGHAWEPAGQSKGLPKSHNLR